MFDENPDMIQDPADFPWIKDVRETPLVLLHDGGGTTFAYYHLGELHRVVHGIHNPCYDTPRIWPGGIPEMARHYSKLVKTVVPRGRVLLGGWSLGGMVSLAVARILADDPDVDVVGLVMVDSPCPLSYHRDDGDEERTQIAESDVRWGPNTRPETRRAVMACFREAGRMLGEWELPTWEHAGAKDTAAARKTWKGRPPPAILLRAIEPVPSAAKDGSRVDRWRGERLLGWERYRRDLVVQVVDIPGHHFNIFSDPDNAEAATRHIKQACDDLETMARRARARHAS